MYTQNKIHTQYVSNIHLTKVLKSIMFPSEYAMIFPDLLSIFSTELCFILRILQKSSKKPGMKLCKLISITWHVFEQNKRLVNAEPVSPIIIFA